MPSERGGPNKKLYAITSAGRKKFSHWLESEEESRMFLRDPFLMRFIAFRETEYRLKKKSAFRAS
jgi:DNA-binding PadR family transcriptional regulator